VDDIKSGPDRDHVEPKRILFLGVCTTVLAIAFIALLIGDNVSAMTPIQ